MMMPRAHAVVPTLALALATQAVASTSIEGKVTTSGGVPVERAVVELSGGDARATTGHDGRFELTVPGLPCRISVSHLRFETRDVEVSEAVPLQVKLVPKLGVFEDVVVSAERTGTRLSPASADATAVSVADHPASPATVLEVLTEIPGVAESGQGGIFQSYSIRGIAGQRLVSLIDGMNILGERRAGVSASFLDPTLLDEVEVVRGPAGVTYGTGAMGGVMHVRSRSFDGWRLAAGYDTEGAENYQSVGWGGSGWSVGVARRDAGNGETARGQETNDHFTQYSATISRVFDLEDVDVGIQLIPTKGSDIGKSNTDYPGRVTTYPDEDHLLGRVFVEGKGWEASVWAHGNDLHTRVRRDDGDGSDVRNQSLDLGANGQIVRSLAAGLTGVVGLDYVGRRGVDAREERFEDFDPSRLERLHTLDAAQDDLSAYGILRYTRGTATIQGGARFLYDRQDNAVAQTDEDSKSDTGVAAFVGANVGVAEGVEILANVGTGLRFPSLTERFFSGTTGRGGVIGNPDLEPERSLDVDAGVRWFGGRAFVEAFAFRNAVDDFIDQVDVDDDTTTFVNLTKGTITGVTLDGFAQATDDLRIRWSGQWLRGRTDGGDPLADVPAQRLGLGADYEVGPVTLGLDAAQRFSKSDPGSGEKEIPSATLVTASVAWRIVEGLDVRLYGTNLVDEEYFGSADAKVTEAPGRAFGIGVTYRP